MVLERQESLLWYLLLIVEDHRSLLRELRLRDLWGLEMSCLWLLLLCVMVPLCVGELGPNLLSCLLLYWLLHCSSQGE